MKTRKEILIAHHDSALAQWIAEEVNIKHLERKMLIIKPGDEYNKIQSMLTTKKSKAKNLGEVVKVIEDLLEELKNPKKEVKA